VRINELFDDSKLIQKKHNRNTTKNGIVRLNKRRNLLVLRGMQHTVTVDTVARAP